MNSAEHRISDLIALLREAADRWNALVHQDIWGSDETASGLGSFCNDAADALARTSSVHSLSRHQAERLWHIFAPTCEWDDSVGDAELGNRIFELVDGLFRSVVMDSEGGP